MYHAPKRKTPPTTLMGPLMSAALMVLLASATGCAGDDAPEDDVSPSPTAPMQAQRASAEPGHREPVEPPNPATHRLPMHNPGGLDRYRPARPVPGLD